MAFVESGGSRPGEAERGDPAVAVLIPCFNEAVTVGAVVRSFRSSLPSAKVYVYDNNSTDATARLAAEAGAIVRTETRQGKGYVVRRMFADVEADVYLLVDGDDTYDAGAAPDLIAQVVTDGVDVANGSRRSGGASRARRGHETGNTLIAGAVSWMFRRPAGDMLSGYKAFSRRFVKSFPVSSAGFEIETELTVHALDLEMPMADVELEYRERPEGSESKLSTVGDGVRIARTIGRLFRMERPLAFYSIVAGLIFVLAIILGVPIVAQFAHTHMVPRFPTAFLVVGLLVIACLSLVSGLVLDTVTRGRREAKMLSYLAIAGPLAATWHGRSATAERSAFSKTSTASEPPAPLDPSAPSERSVTAGLPTTLEPSA